MLTSCRPCVPCPQVCRLSQRMDEACDMTGVDVVVVGIFHQVRESGQVPHPDTVFYPMKMVLATLRWKHGWFSMANRGLDLANLL